jgi:hypothetical protein
MAVSVLTVVWVTALQELKGTEGRGIYFSATDRAPDPGEYKYLEPLPATIT